MTNSTLPPSPPVAQAASAPAAPSRLLARVDRGINDLRLGTAVGITTTAPQTAPDPGAVLTLAAESVTADSLSALAATATPDPIAPGQPPATRPRVVITGRRAAVLGLAEGGAAPVAVTLADPLDPEAVARLADPCLDAIRPLPPLTEVARIEPGSPAAAAVQLAKLARLLPAAVIVPLPKPGRSAAPIVPASDGGEGAPRRLTVAEITGYQEEAARSLRLVGEARVPLASAEDARILAFRPSDGGTEHVAILIGRPDPAQPVLCRLHSECFTGDLLGSLRCDCGDQLRGAIDAIAAQGAGVLLYLAQEGRGIGLVNKLRAYQLQDQGFDTLDANGQLGFDDDERIYLPAARILGLLGLHRVRLLTNNPQKMEALARHGIAVVERVPHAFAANPHSLRYLETKAHRGGHLF